MADTKNPALSGEAQALARVLREAGKLEEADRVLERAGLSSVPAPEPPAALATPPVEFEEFNVEPHAAPPAPAPAPEFVEDFGSETIRLEEAEEIEPGMPTGRVPEPASPSASDSEFVSYEQLGSLIEEEMLKAGGEAPTGAPSGPLVNEENLFADEQEFFNLAEELERELADEPSVPQAPAMEGPQGEVSLEEIFREFKKGVEQQLSAEDYETHYNLGIAYKEMGLIDEAIGEFQLASKDSARMVECCSMLGLCFLEKGMPQLAIKWYRKGLEAPQLREAEHLGLLYDLACVYQDTGELDLAYRTFLEIYGLNTNYRDVVSRVKDLEAVRKS
jgi:tetratricopeptide (TPR) repeat protein